jgi:hypothetical protein
MSNSPTTSSSSDQEDEECFFQCKKCDKMVQTANREAHRTWHEKKDPADQTDYQIAEENKERQQIPTPNLDFQPCGSGGSRSRVWARKNPNTNSFLARVKSLQDQAHGTGYLFGGSNTCQTVSSTTLQESNTVEESDEESDSEANTSNETSEANSSDTESDGSCLESDSIKGSDCKETPNETYIPIKLDDEGIRSIIKAAKLSETMTRTSMFLYGVTKMILFLVSIHLLFVLVAMQCNGDDFG